MRVLFVNHLPAYCVKDRDPLGIMCLSAALRQAGHETRFTLPRMDAIAAAMGAFSPQVIACTVTTATTDFYLRAKFGK
jgi:hypothetical protein